MPGKNLLELLSTEECDEISTLIANVIGEEITSSGSITTLKAILANGDLPSVSAMTLVLNSANDDHYSIAQDGDAETIIWTIKMIGEVLTKRCEIEAPEVKIIAEIADQTVVFIKRLEEVNKIDTDVDEAFAELRTNMTALAETTKDDVRTALNTLVAALPEPVIEDPTD